MSTSKTLLGIHLTASGVSYYERIFLRAVIAARVSFGFKNLTARKEVKSNKERNQLLQIASGECQEPAMQVYVDRLRDLDEKREGLDFEIQDMLLELDTQATFADITQDAKLTDLPKDSKVGTLVGKLVERQKEIEA